MGVLLRATGLLLTGGGAGALYLHKTDEAFRRSCDLYSVAGPVVLNYRFVEAKQKWFPKSQEEHDAEWTSLDLKHSDNILAMVQDLKGMYIKYGQIGAGLTNTFSDIWIEKLRKLEDQVEPQPASVVLQTIEEDFDKPTSEIFEYFDNTPLGSASIGQVHRAKLKGGQEVAVKVQYPSSERLFRSDMKTIRGFLDMFAPEQAIIMDELERNFESEFNYEIEAQNLVEASKNLRKAGFENEAYVPQPIDATRRVLLMELLSGPKLRDGIRKYARVLAEKEGLTLEQFEAREKERIEREGCVPYTGPTATKMALYIKLFKVWDKTMNVGVSLYNNILGKWIGYPMGWYETVMPPNVPRLMEALMRIHGNQLMRDGFFNADPHAGNFLLMDDGRIGLIDYGSTKRLMRSDRLVATLLYLALQKGDDQMIKRICVNGGYKSKYQNEEIMFKLMKFGFDSYSKDLLGGKNIQQFMDELYAADPWEQGADNLVMANFLSIRLRAVGMQMGHPVVCSDYWGPMAEKILEEEGLPYEVWDDETLKKVAPPELMTISKPGAKVGIK